MDEAIMKIIKKIAPSRTFCVLIVRSKRYALALSEFLYVKHLGLVVLVSTPLLVCSPQLLAHNIFGSNYAISDTNYKITMPGAAPAFNWQSEVADVSPGLLSEARTEMLFKLSFYPRAEMAGNNIESPWSGGVSMERIDFMPADEIKMQDIIQGFAYSARLDIEKPHSVVDESPYVSSRQLGVHYGRLGSVNYSGVDLGFRQFNNSEHFSESSDKDLWSLGVTTGKRFALTGLEQNDPLWTVSLRGQFSLIEDRDDKVRLDNHLWFLSPGLYWQNDSFELSADVLMPFINSGETEEETDYRIRAKIQKRF